MGSAEIFVNRMMDAFKQDEMWIFLARAIVVECSESFLDYVEEARELVIGRDIKNVPFHNLTTTHAIERRTDPYKLFFVGQISGVGKRADVIPFQYKDYRFTVTISLNENNIRSPETYSKTSSLKPPLART